MIAPERIVNGTKSRIDHATVNGSPVAGNTDLLKEYGRSLSEKLENIVKVSS